MKRNNRVLPIIFLIAILCFNTGYSRNFYYITNSLYKPIFTEKNQFELSYETGRTSLIYNTDLGSEIDNFKINYSITNHLLIGSNFTKTQSFSYFDKLITKQFVNPIWGSQFYEMSIGYNSRKYDLDVNKFALLQSFLSYGKSQQNHYFDISGSRDRIDFESLKLQVNLHSVLYFYKIHLSYCYTMSYGNIKYNVKDSVLSNNFYGRDQMLFLTKYRFHLLEQELALRSGVRNIQLQAVINISKVMNNNLVEVDDVWYRSYYNFINTPQFSLGMVFFLDKKTFLSKKKTGKSNS